MIFFFHHFPVEASMITRMAGSANLADFCQNRIIVAVNGQRFHILQMTACHSFGPQFLTAAAPVSHLTGLQSCLKCFLIHIGNHQHFRSLIILYHHRYQSVRIRTHIVPCIAASQCVHLQAAVCRFCFQCHEISRAG